jgi:hypothetical protein
MQMTGMRRLRGFGWAGMLVWGMALAGCPGGDSGAADVDSGGAVELPDDPAPDLSGDPGTDAGADEAADPAVDWGTELAADSAGDPGTQPDADPCLPRCEGRACGPDGCGGDCGACEGPASCDVVRGECAAACDPATGNPAVWGPAGAVDASKCLSDAAQIAATCFDYDGDGKGDSGLGKMCNQITNPDPGPASDGSMPLVLELGGVVTLPADGPFPLNVLPAVSAQEPAATSGPFQVRETAYQPGNCRPRIAFPGTTIVAGHLSAGPADSVVIDFPLAPGLSQDLRLIDARVTGDVTAGGGPAGITVTNGVFTAILTKRELTTAIDRAQATCDAVPAGGTKPDWCAYLSVLRSSMAPMMNLHRTADGTYVAKSPATPANAAAICYTFTLAPAQITGYVPAP